jgi:hypothetical protein
VILRLITFNDTHTRARARSVEFLWTSDQLVAETSTSQHTSLYKRKTSLPRVGLEPAIPGSERPQTQGLDSAPPEPAH